MAEHDQLCEKADVGSLCDCSCAGAKHAILHTKGGVPGAGAVSRRAQKAAAGAGKAAVINNRAQPKQGSRIAPSAPKSFTEPAAGAPAGGKGGPVRDTGPKGPQYSKGTPTDQRTTARTLRAFDGTGAELVHTGNVKPGDRITHVRDGVGTVTKTGRYSGDMLTVNFDTGGTKAVFGHQAVTGEHPEHAKAAQAAADAARAVADGKANPGSLNALDDRQRELALGELRDIADARRNNPGPNRARQALDDYQAGPQRVDASKFRRPQPAAKPATTATGKPAITFMSDLSKYDDAELQAEHDRIESLIKRQGGLTGIQRDLQQKIERTLAARKAAGSSRPQAPAGPVAKVPAPLRDILAVLDNPDGHMDTAAAARYQKLTRDHMAMMTPEQKQSMLDDVRGRAKSYKPNSPTGQKLQRAFDTLVHSGSEHKAGMKAGPKLQVRAGDQVTHPEHGHGKVKTTGLGGDVKTVTATVDFGDKTVQVPQQQLTFGHVGADTSPAAKASAAATRDKQRTAKAGAGMTGLADKILGHKTDSYTPLAERTNDIAALNELSRYDPATFTSLPPGDRKKVTDALNRMTTKTGAREVRQRAADTLAKFTGATAAQVARDPDPRHIADAKRALDGGNTTLPRSMVYAQVSQASLRDAFTGEQRAKMRADAVRILDKMPADAPDRPGLQRVVADIDTIDAPGAGRGAGKRDVMTVTSRRRNGDATTQTVAKPSTGGKGGAGEKVTTAGTGGDGGGGGGGGASGDRDRQMTELRTRMRLAEQRSMNSSLPFAQRNAARADMHEAHNELFRLENPFRTPGPGAETFQGKKVPALPASQQPVLESIGSGMGYKGLPRGAVGNLERTGHITTILSNGNAVLTEKGHVKLAAQRGDATHQALNEDVAKAEADFAQIAKARSVHAAVPLSQKDNRDWSRRSADLAQQMEQARTRIYQAQRRRAEHLNAAGR